MKPSQAIHQPKSLKAGLGLALFTSGMVSALADLAHAF